MTATQQEICPKCGGDGMIRCEDPECAVCACDTYCEKCVECTCCNCGTLDLRHPYASPGCEFHNHHCEDCHTNARCTHEACKLDFEVRGQVKELEARSTAYRILLFQVHQSFLRGDYREALAYLERVDRGEV